MKWKAVLLRLLIEFILDKLPEIANMILNDLSHHDDDHHEDSEDKGDAK